MPRCKSQYNIQQVKAFTTMYAHNYLGNNVCRLCQLHHPPNQTCKIPCAYCHQVHSKEAMVDNICPKMAKHAKEVRPSSQLKCYKCEGQGVLQKQTVVTYRESQSKYDKRVRQFLSSNQHEGEVVEEPVRLIIKTEVNSVQQICKDCKGSGTIDKVIHCCLRGCSSCSYQRCFINPKWQQAKILSSRVICERQMNCSSCWQLFKVGEKVFGQGCRHIYHVKCYKQNGWECHCYNEEVRQALHEEVEYESSVQQEESFISSRGSNSSLLRIRPQMSQQEDQQDFAEHLNEIQMITNLLQNQGHL